MSGGPSDVSLGLVHRTVGRYRWWSVVVPGRPSLSSLKVRLGYHNPVCSDASYAEIPEDFKVLQSKDIMLFYSGPCAVRIAGLNCHVCEDRGVMMPFIRGEGGGESPCLGIGKSTTELGGSRRAPAIPGVLFIADRPPGRLEIVPNSQVFQKVDLMTENPQNDGCVLIPHVWRAFLVLRGSRNLPRGDLRGCILPAENCHFSFSSVSFGHFREVTETLPAFFGRGLSLCNLMQE